MPTKKKVIKKVNKNLDKGIKEAKRVGEEAVKKLEELKKKFDKMDADTKKKVIAGIAGTVAVLAGLGAAKHAVKKKKK